MSRRAKTKPRSGDDSCIYEEEAIRVGLLLFPGRACTACGDVLPANADYFVADAHRADGLTSSCRRCRRAAQGAYYAGLPPERKAAKSGSRRHVTAATDHAA